MADDDVYRIHINSKQQMSNYIANEKLPDLQYGYKVSQSISTEEYRDVQSELILNNCLNERADFVANPRASSCEPLRRITIRTLEDLQTEQDRLGIKNFTVVVPPDVPRQLRKTIITTAKAREFDVIS